MDETYIYKWRGTHIYNGIYIYLYIMKGKAYDKER